jgi:tRNA A-37 threonylcarbamoyl transferase component Bud32
MAQQKAVEASAADTDDLDDLVDELQPGTKLLKGQYTITRFINSGGFGITYLAKDSLDRNVVIKECFPSSFCRRSKALVAARSRAHTAELRSVVQLFVREARNLSKIVHPNIVAVHQVFEDNGTAYMAIDFIDGLDLQQIIDGQGRQPSPPEVVSMTEKLLHAVGFIHDNDMLHRDISPDNVLIDKNGEPVLIDFGAAREQASQKSRAMSALRVVKDGYSPQEFYIAGSEQGPWSDLYALGATLYHLICGEAPVNGQARLAALAEDRPDPFVPLAGRIPGYPPGFLEAIDRALATLPKQRVQSAREWLLMFHRSVPPGPPRDAVADAVHRTVVDFEIDATDAVALPEPVARQVSAPQPAPQPAPVAASAAATDFGAPPGFARKISVTPAPRVSISAPAPVAAKRGTSPVQVLAGVAVALALIGGGLLMLQGGDDPAVPAAVASSNPPPTSDPAAVATAAVAPAAVAPVAEEAAAVAPVAAEPAEAAPVETAAVETAAPEPVAAAADPVEIAEPVAATDQLGEAEVALLQDASRLSAAEAKILEEILNTKSVRLDFAAPIGTLLENQVTFSVWDIEMPFVGASRIVGGKNTAIIARLQPGVDLRTAGDWIAPGLLLYAVNGVPIGDRADVTGSVLNALRVDPDGKARVVIDYAGSSLEKQTGLLTVKAVRLVSLANGVSFAVTNIDGDWKAVVTEVRRPSESTLRRGDVMFREKTTQLLFDSSESVELILQALVAQGATVANFSVIRNNQVAAAAMRLSVKPTP